MIPDVQSGSSRIRQYLKKVGVRNVEVPLKSGAGTFSVYTDLAPDVRGSHLSRLVEFVGRLAGKDLDELPRSVDSMMQDLRSSLKCELVYVKCRTKYPFSVAAPQTAKEGWMYAEVTLDMAGRPSMPTVCDWTVEVPITTACPCSLELVRYSGKQGIPHSQRGLARVTVRTSVDEVGVVERVTRLVRETVVAPFPVLKRVDELEFAVKLFATPMFVEDAARLLHNKLDNEDWVQDFVIVVETFESIHPHNAVAVTCKGVQYGLR